MGFFSVRYIRMKKKSLKNAINYLRCYPDTFHILRWKFDSIDEDAFAYLKKHKSLSLYGLGFHKNYKFSFVKSYFIGFNNLQKFVK